MGAEENQLAGVTAKLLSRIVMGGDDSKRLDPRMLTALVGCARRLQLVASRLARRLPEGPGPAVLDADAQGDVRQLVALIREFEVQLRKIDLAAMDVFEPDAADMLRRAIHSDLDAVGAMMASPYYELGERPASNSVPELLEQLHAIDYWRETELLDAQLVSADSDMPVEPDTVTALKRLAEELQRVRDKLAEFIREAWSPADLAALEAGEAQSVNIQTGDQFHGPIQGTVITRSTVGELRIDARDPSAALESAEVVNALRDLAQLVQASHSDLAEELLESFKEELDQLRSGRDSPGAIKTTWGKLTAALGPMAQLTAIADTLSKLM
jgi:hypothetical protein